MTLKEALEGLTEDRFCTRVFALGDNGLAVCSDDPQACKWCVRGWLNHINASEVVFDAAYKCAQQLGYELLSDANDLMGYKFVEALRNWEEPK